MERVAGWFTNPAAWAVRGYRISHWLWVHKHHFLARLVMTFAYVLTNIEIHPMASIGPRFAIGHGSGTVIGGFSIIGADCLIRQGVTLGERSASVDASGKRCHPALGDRVDVGANACLLGPITIGDDAKIGAGAVVLCDVPAGWSAVGNPARLLPPKDQRDRKPVPSAYPHGGPAAKEWGAP